VTSRNIYRGGRCTRDLRYVDAMTGRGWKAFWLELGESLIAFIERRVYADCGMMAHAAETSRIRVSALPVRDTAIVTAFFAALFSACAVLQAKDQEIVLSSPVECDIGKDCFVQQYPDVIPSEVAKDYTCGAATYDGHKGIDIRLRSVAEISNGVAVIAAADGHVKAVRDGMLDRLLWDPSDRASVRGRECGNGVVISHGEGWETQYCHLRRGSIAVAVGDKVSRGDELGQIGASGDTQFAHVQMSVRQDGEPHSPFLARPTEQGCAEDPSRLKPGLWTTTAYEALKAQGSQIISGGFTAGRVTTRQLEAGRITEASRQAEALVFYARAINLLPSDQLRITVSGPDGFHISRTSAPLRRNKAQYVHFIGKKTSKGWATGIYKGVARIIRDDNSASEFRQTIKLD